MTTHNEFSKFMPIGVESSSLSQQDEVEFTRHS